MAKKRKIKTTQVTKEGNFYNWLNEARQLLKDKGLRNNEIREREAEMKAAFDKNKTPADYVRAL